MKFLQTCGCSEYERSTSSLQIWFSTWIGLRLEGSDSRGIEQCIVFIFGLLGRTADRRKGACWPIVGAGGHTRDGSSGDAGTGMKCTRLTRLLAVRSSHQINHSSPLLLNNKKPSPSPHPRSSSFPRRLPSNPFQGRRTYQPRKFLYLTLVLSCILGLGPCQLFPSPVLRFFRPYIHQEAFTFVTILQILYHIQL